MQSKKRYLYIFVVNGEEQVILIHLNYHFFKWISKIKIMNSNQTNGAGKYKECSQGRQFIYKFNLIKTYTCNKQDIVAFEQMKVVFIVKY
ncbi:hypothetical protein T06_15705 [Trichinella sp. T6]|nr:hypothetical protein T06_15705 [Trichinella sp. T6]